MLWTFDLMKKKTDHEVVFLLNEKNPQRIYNMHIGIYKLTCEPIDGHLRFMLECPNYSKTQKRWHVNLELELTFRFTVRDYPDYSRDYSIEFSNKVRSRKAKVDEIRSSYYVPCFTDPTGTIMKVTATFRIVSHEGLPNSNMCKLIYQVCQPPNIRLIVDNKPIEVQKEMLIENSSVFKEMLTKERQKSDIELKDVDYQEFIFFLGVLHGFYHPDVDHVVLEILFRLSYKYQVSWMKTKCLKYLNHLEHHDLAPFLLLAENNKDKRIMLDAIESIESRQQQYGVMTSSMFKQLRLETQRRVLIEFARKQRTNKILSTFEEKTFTFNWYG